MCLEPSHHTVPRGWLHATGLRWGGTSCGDNRHVMLYLGLAVHLPLVTPGLEMPLRFNKSVGGTPSPLPAPLHRGDCPQQAWAEWGLSLVKSNKSPKWEAAAKGNKEQLCPRVPHLQFQWAMKAPDQDELWSQAVPGPPHPPVPQDGLWCFFLDDSSSWTHVAPCAEARQK